MTLGIGSKARTRQAAFTLIELSIVVFILAVVLAISAPSFVRSYNASLLTEAGRTFSTTCQLARIQAVSQQQPVTMHIDLDTQQYWLTQPLRSEGGGLENLTVKAVKLSNQVLLVDAVRQDLPSSAEKQVDVVFYPNGTCDPIFITLQGTEKGRGLCAIIDPITTRATIYPVKL